MASCRTSRPASSFKRLSTTCCALNPLRSSSSPRGPKDLFTKDCVATAPAPASAQDTAVPTENQWLCTPTPISPVFSSRATMEKVCASGSFNLCTWAFKLSAAIRQNARENILDSMGKFYKHKLRHRTKQKGSLFSDPSIIQYSNKH